ncbi:hypothetical protein A4X09_0g2805 [Tilletia walkeri]|uniref:Uncharacterized protein n=1 Tax=Tilletia walkeri TaxID=117179 RepID=A0A8X7T666_9BASI|nr:hypothetical protein A4X09_0g2805 [Tilletia walkeri]
MAVVMNSSIQGVAPCYETVFSHLSVRLIKTLVDSPPNTPPLNHIHGPMQLVAVSPDPPMLPTLIISLPGFTLPFRTFNPSTVGSSGIHDAEPPRPTYASFGAGEHGLDGPAIWFKEHITEEGAWARKSLGQPAAVWTLYLIGAPSPLATHLREVLSGWPRNMPPALPKWLTDPAMYGWPWKDQFIQMPLPLELAQPVAVGVTAPRPLPTPPIDVTASKEPTAPNLPPPIPAKPTNLRLSNIEHNAWAEEAEAVPTAEAQEASASPSLIEEAVPTAEANETAASPARSVRSAQFPDPYRHSLVAVDNETGEVLGILASNVVLAPGQEDQADTTITQTEEDDAATPHASRFLTSKALPPIKPEEPQRAFSAYRDPDIYSPYAPSDDPDKVVRPPSQLGAHTFAPPPLPDKADDEAGWAGESVRDSMASAAFFSAAEELDSGAEDPKVGHGGESEDDVSEGHAKSGVRPAIKLGSDPVLKAVEGYREGLLRDEVADEDEGAESDRSGSTVGGILARAFKKKNKRKGSKKEAEIKEEEVKEQVKELAGVEGQEWIGEDRQLADPLSADVSRSSALTASEPTVMEVRNVGTSDSLSVLRPSTISNRLPQHLPRTQLRTSALIDVEHQVWKDALSQNELPASAPYTHLTAAVTGAKSAAEDEGWKSGSGGEVESGSNAYVDPDESLNAASRAAAVAAAAGEYIQGGTVLLKFLQGTITASMVNPAQLARYVGGGAAEQEESSSSDSAATPEAPSAAAAEKPEDLRTGAMAYIPVLPVHLLYYMGIVTEKPPPSEGSLPSAAQGALDSVARAAGVGFGVGRLWNTLIESAVGQSSSNATAALSSITPANVSLDMLGMSRDRVTACWNWVSSTATAGVQATTGALQSVGAAVSTATTAPLVRSSSRDLAVARNGNPNLEEDDDDWEVTIPDFDPNSLGSTPRPVYRRKAKSILPSSTNGFGLAGISSNSIDWKRVSIVHFDAKGVGRRAVMDTGGFGAL